MDELMSVLLDNAEDEGLNYIVLLKFFREEVLRRFCPNVSFGSLNVNDYFYFNNVLHMKLDGNAVVLEPGETCGHPTTFKPDDMVYYYFK